MFMRPENTTYTTGGPKIAKQVSLEEKEESICPQKAWKWGERDKVGQKGRLESSTCRL